MVLGRPAGRLFLALAITLATPPAQAGDRPFLATTTAAGEPDHDEVWAVDTVLQHTRGEGRAWRGGAWGLTLLAEAALAGETTLANAGVRWWLKREKLALDLSALRSRTESRVERGLLFGVSLQDF